jgi:hypothetical protein
MRCALFSLFGAQVDLSFVGACSLSALRRRVDALRAAVQHSDTDDDEEEEDESDGEETGRDTYKNQPMQIQGLSNRPELNGTMCVAGQLDVANRRLTVQTWSNAGAGEQFKLKLDNLDVNPSVNPSFLHRVAANHSEDWRSLHRVTANHSSLHRFTANLTVRRSAVC